MRDVKRKRSAGIEFGGDKVLPRSSRSRGSRGGDRNEP